MTTPTITCTAARHGTSSAYKKAGCRCPEARAAETARKAGYERNRTDRIRTGNLAGSIVAACPPFHADPRRHCAYLDNPDVMFPATTKDTPKAQAVCSGCPFKQACADWAVQTRQIYGVWGGTAPAVRRRLIARLIEIEKAAA